MPGLAEIEAEARSRDNGKLAALVDSLRMALEDGARSAGATVEAIIKQEYAAYQVAADEAIAREAAGAIARAGSSRRSASAAAAAMRTPSTKKGTGASTWRSG